MTTRPFHMLATVAALAGLAVALQTPLPQASRIASGQATISPTGGFWPPRPENIVHLSSRTQNAPATLAPQQLWSAMFVPPGSSLVITNASILSTEVSFVEGIASELHFKRTGESQPVLRDSPLDVAAPLGWVFAGGSQVGFQNDGATAQPLEYELVGYLVRD